MLRRIGTVIAIAITLAVVGALPAGDVLRPQNTATKEIGAIVDGIKGGEAVNDERYSDVEFGGFFGTLFPTLPIAEFTSDAGNAEVIAFARRRPPALVENVPWSLGNNSIDVPFDDEYFIPVKVWILASPFVSVSTTAAFAAVDTAEIWADERQGITFSEFDIVDASDKDGIEDLLDFDCSDSESIKTVVGHDPTRLNVYYVDTVDFGAGAYSSNGVWCAGTSNLIAMGKWTSGPLLAHELGHAFALGHTNGNPVNFDTTNVMHNSSSERRYLTEGQTFRAVFHGASAINATYDVRAGDPTRDCAHHFSPANPLCPPVQKRVWADGIWPPN